MKNEIWLGDCLELMKDIPDGSIDMILCDLPYGGLTQNKWDKLIPLEDYVVINDKVYNENDYVLQCVKNNDWYDVALKTFNQNKKLGLWSQYKRIIKDNGAIVLTSSEPFTSKLIMSNLEMYRYDLVWNKKRTTGQLNAKKMPLRQHESILLFYKKLPTYNPQMHTDRYPRDFKGVNIKQSIKNSSNYGKQRDYISTVSSDSLAYPKSIIPITTVISNSHEKLKNPVHPTQKPIALFKYLINTYSNEGDLILDNAAGSMTTAVACLDTHRNYLCIEKEEIYYNQGLERIDNHKRILKNNKLF